MRVGRLQPLEVCPLANLRREGVEQSKIHHVGNVMIDSLIHYRPKAEQSRVLDVLKLKVGQFVLVTLHRPSNVDSEASLTRILGALSRLAERIPVVFPVHPRTRKMIDTFKLSKTLSLAPDLTLAEPFGYFDFLKLMMNATLVLTDSGGIQEETTFLGIPCLTLRDSTERPITVEIGTNTLCGLDVDVALRSAAEILDGKTRRGKIPELWDGKAGERIARSIAGALT